MFHQEETQRTTQDMLEGLCVSASLELPWDSPRGAGQVAAWKEGSLGLSA